MRVINNERVREVEIETFNQHPDGVSEGHMWKTGDAVEGPLDEIIIPHGTHIRLAVHAPPPADVNEKQPFSTIVDPSIAENDQAGLEKYIRKIAPLKESAIFTGGMIVLPSFIVAVFAWVVLWTTGNWHPMPMMSDYALLLGAGILPHIVWSRTLVWAIFVGTSWLMRGISARAFEEAHGDWVYKIIKGQIKAVPAEKSDKNILHEHGYMYPRQFIIGLALISAIGLLLPQTINVLSVPIIIIFLVSQMLGPHILENKKPFASVEAKEKFETSGIPFAAQVRRTLESLPPLPDGPPESVIATSLEAVKQAYGNSEKIRNAFILYVLPAAMEWAGKDPDRRQRLKDYLIPVINAVSTELRTTQVPRFFEQVSAHAPGDMPLERHVAIVKNEILNESPTEKSESESYLPAFTRILSELVENWLAYRPIDVAEFRNYLQGKMLRKTFIQTWPLIDRTVVQLQRLSDGTLFLRLIGRISPSQTLLDVLQKLKFNTSRYQRLIEKFIEIEDAAAAHEKRGLVPANLMDEWLQQKTQPASGEEDEVVDDEKPDDVPFTFRKPSYEVHLLIDKQGRGFSRGRWVYHKEEGWGMITSLEDRPIKDMNGNAIDRPGQFMHIQFVNVRKDLPAELEMIDEPSQLAAQWTEKPVQTFSSSEFTPTLPKPKGNQRSSLSKS